MTAILANVNKFLVSTDFPFDKVAYLKEFSTSVPQSPDMAGASIFTIAHGLPFRPLCAGVYTDSSFATTYDFGSSPMFYDTAFSQWGQRIISVVESDATNIYILVYNRDTTRNMSFRVYGFPDSTYTGDASATSTITNNFLLNTDNNYMKLFDSGTASVITPSDGTVVNVVAPHALGYVPYAMAWTEIAGRTRQATYENYVGTGPVDVTAAMTTASLTVGCSSFSTNTVAVHWRTYVDA